MNNGLRYAAQALVYGGFAAILGVFSAYPEYDQVDPGTAQLKMGFTHVGAPIGGCRRRGTKELGDLAANMRKTFDCPRGRTPLHIRLDIDGETVLDRLLTPTGIHNDGPSKIYAKFNIAPGPHEFHAQLRDSERADGFDYNYRETVTLNAGQSIALDFNASTGGFNIE